MIAFFKETFHLLIQEIKLNKYRYLYSQFNLDNRLTGIIGQRGVGKTTLMLQYIKNNYYDNREAFYFTADHIYFNGNSLFEFVRNLYQTEGVKLFFIDEIHKYKNWNQELKNIYDAIPSIKIVFSGSSSIDLIKGSYDLSRRSKIFYLSGLSFREYINFSTGSNFEVIPYKALMENYQGYAGKLSIIPGLKGQFQKYIETGFYPFVFESEHSYYEKIGRIVDKTIHEDIAGFYNLKTENLPLFKKLINYLSTIEPGKINTHNLSKRAGFNDKTISNYLSIMNDVGLARFVLPHGTGSVLLSKPSKVFINNTTLLHAMNCFLGKEVSKGLERELFFIQSVAGANEKIEYSEIGDYQVGETIFEIGGKNKKNRQIKNHEKAFLVKDDSLVGGKNEIPLYCFGFLY